MDLNRRSLLSTFIAAPFASVLTARASVSKPETGAPDLIAELQAAYDGIFRDGKRPTPVDALAITKEQAIRRALQIHEENGDTDVVVGDVWCELVDGKYDATEGSYERILIVRDLDDPREARPAKWEVDSFAWSRFYGEHRISSTQLWANHSGEAWSKEHCYSRDRLFWHGLNERLRYTYLAAWLETDVAKRRATFNKTEEENFVWMLKNARRKAGLI